MSVRPRMTHLFEQLGLDSSEQAIALFVRPINSMRTLKLHKLIIGMRGNVNFWPKK